MSVAACLALFIAHPAHALTQFDFEQAYFSDPGQPVLDHCVVQEGGLYHLFYLRGNPAVNIGHATTTDFIHWQIQTPVLAPGTWDMRLWAPFLFKKNNTWWMYYTGVNATAAQQSGLAISSDLSQWFKLGNPVYHPDPSWAVWDQATFCHGRDPHIIEENGVYYMLVTAQTNGGYKGAVGCATSTDLINWTDAGPIYVHNNWHMLESVFILKRDNLYHMFFTEEAVNGTSHMSSPTLFGGWDPAQKLWLDTGHAPQITDTPSGPIFSRHSVYNDMHGLLRYCLKFSPLLWFGNTPSTPKFLPLGGTWTFVSGDAFYYQPTFNNNAFVRNDVYPSSFVGDGWINTYELYTGPIAYGSPGQAQGDARTGVMRSPLFTIEGNSMSVLVGGGEFPEECYVALVDNATGEHMFSETGRNTNVMDRRYWDISSLVGRTMYIEVADQSTAYFGHICVDDIQESGNRLTWEPGVAKGTGKKARGVQLMNLPAQARMLANTPNPFNPTTTIRFELPTESRTRIDVYDATGALVRTLVDETRAPGSHSVAWDGSDRFGRSAASGIYFARFQVDGVLIETRKMMLLK